ncbi:hypothetical protein RHMOL_Rhmol03G0221600 [Rhododendron molle]|uniref:Uncharacterized protein n=1 Tax=Rhododendron molle TaxID=49168 RepID=A0ACC0PIE4_RHOML|nr:hypothetical protein RHMOL_Rhmol03G0221600 [Rhododendron molle]
MPVSVGAPQAIRRAQAFVKSAEVAKIRPNLQKRACPPLSLAKKRKVALLWEDKNAPSQLNLTQ